MSTPHSSPENAAPRDTTRLYTDGEVTVRLRRLESGSTVMLHIEHLDGAALIVPQCPRELAESGPILATQGFDGTLFRVHVDEGPRTLRIESSAPSAILGGLTARTLVRRADELPRAAMRLRMTGDEVTHPIHVGTADSEPGAAERNFPIAPAPKAEE